jgi:Zn-dependent protease
MRRYSLRDWLVLALIGLAVLYFLNPNLFRQPGRLNENLYEIVVKLLVLAVSITVHEFGHAIVAYKLGDDTPKRQGRVSLNPIRHLDPLGTFMILFGPIGWGKPVQWNPGNIRKSSIQVALVAVSLAGIGMNLLLAALVATVPDAAGVSLPREAGPLLQDLFELNILLAAFNILPIPPLDGYNFWLGVLPSSLAQLLWPLDRYGFLILLALVMLPQFGGPNILSMLISPVATFFAQLVTGGFI